MRRKCSVNLQEAEDWKTLLKDMISDCEAKDIFNVDEGASQAYEYVSKLRKYLESQYETEHILSSLNTAEDFIIRKKISNFKQTTLDNYFKKS